MQRDKYQLNAIVDNFASCVYWIDKFWIKYEQKQRLKKRDMIFVIRFYIILFSRHQVHKAIFFFTFHNFQLCPQQISYR